MKAEYHEGRLRVGETFGVTTMSQKLRWLLMITRALVERINESLGCVTETFLLISA